MFDAKFLWVATPLFLGKQKVMTMQQLKDAGFDKGNAHKAASGVRNEHHGHIFKRVPREIGKKDLEKVLGEEILRSIEMGLRPDPTSRMKRPIVAVDRATGKGQIFYSVQSLEAAGFNSSNVISVMQGNRASHKNHTFYRVAADAWNCKGLDNE
ncbi:hypothetical protein SP695_004641 [Salmonella enterica]|nr:hypothetical protein [Salmonella enterica]